MFNRSNDASYPAKVSDFRLDAYEITVGRFKKFVAAYRQDIIEAGAGKNPNNASDPGWDPLWKNSLPADAEALSALIQGPVGSAAPGKCNAAYQTFSAGNDRMPVNCINWFEAQAFCIWDGGRLPTEAEWNYVASGGSEQRVYPWGITAPGADTKLAIYGCYLNGAGSCTGAIDIGLVGSVSAGNAKWGHADMAGNLAEWAQDYYKPGDLYLAECDNCSDIVKWPMEEPGRVTRGGSFSADALSLQSSNRSGNIPWHHLGSFGARCARD